ncbi:MAG: hypothetical protein ABF479_19375 [Gluconacetobacter sp.]
MTGYAIPATAACAVLIAMVGLTLYVLHLARQAAQARDAAKAASAAQARAVDERAMAQAQVTAAPTDEALDRALTGGTF